MAPAAPIELPSPPPITDRIALGALTSTFPPELVDWVVAGTGRAEQRRRLLPARVVVYFVLALALYSHAAYEEVLRCLVEGLGWAVRARQGRRSWPYWHVPGASALGEARERLGAEPLKVLFAQAARPLATVATRGAWYRRWRLLVVDGTCLEVSDTPENAAAFGRPGSGRGEGRGAFPQVWVVGLVEPARTRSSTPLRVPTAAGSRRWPAGWPAGAARWARWAPGCCCWPTGCLQARSCGRPWPAPARIWCGGSSAQQDRPKLPVDQVLADGSWLSRSYAASDRRRRHPIVVRVVEYSLSDPGRRTSVDATGW